jgi:undecaprenyl-diphosphatase
MTLFQSIVLGIVQGITEFLPISSSAHLILVPWILGWPHEGGLTFDVALHAGTLVAILFYFWREWYQFTAAAFRLRPKHLKSMEALKADPELKMGLFIVLATIPAAVLGLILEKYVETLFRNPPLNATVLAIVGFILWYVDSRSKRHRSLERLEFKDAMLIGVAQSFALVPGVSRSGATITAGLLLGYDRSAAARFSFFLSMPIIAGACVFKLRHLHLSDIDGVFLAGITASAVSGFVAIGGLLKILKTKSYGVFAIYRILMAAFVWALIFARS